jgi:hypothetical protein
VKVAIFGRRLRYSGAVALLIAGTVGWGVAAASPAEACSLTSHCWGDVSGGVSGINGDYVFITPSCLNIPSGNFVTDELWLGNGADWVEVGYLQHGGNLNLGGITTAGRYGFWGDKRPGYNFSAHVLQNNPSLSGGAPAEIYKTGTNTWETYFNGYFGTSTGNTMTPTYGSWGSETTSGSADSLSTGTGTEYRTGSTWTNGVPHPGTPQQNSPQTFSWTTRYTAYKAGVPC